MNALASPLRRRPLTSCAILACLLGWSPFILVALGLGSDPSNAPVGPAIAAFVVAAAQGRDGLREWGRTLRHWRASPWLYAVAFVAPFALHVGIVLVNHGFGAPLPTGDQLGDWPQVPVTFVLMMVLVGVGEEAGWTAFAAPVLLRRHRLLRAWALLAALRVLWHLPLMLSGQMPWVMGLLGNAGFQFLVLVLLQRSHGCWVLPPSGTRPSTPSAAPSSSAWSSAPTATASASFSASPTPSPPWSCSSC